MIKKTIKQQIIDAGYIAINELIKVAESPIFNDEPGDEFDSSKYDLAADRLKNAAAAKKLAIFDALEILSRINAENENESEKITTGSRGFAESFAK